MIAPRIASVACLGLAVALAGCGTSPVGPGPAAPASTVPFVVAGTPTMTAGLVGTTVGADLPAADRNVGLEAEYRALEFGTAGTPVAWTGSQSGVTGEVVPGARYRVNEFECRDYTHTLMRGGQTEAARGTACREADGSWAPVA